MTDVSIADVAYCIVDKKKRRSEKATNSAVMSNIQLV
jgi:hypothetical protein